MEKESGTRMASTKEEEEVSSKAEVEEEEKEKEEVFQTAKEKVKEEEIPLLESAITVESLVTTNLSAGRRKEILEVLEKFKKKMRICRCEFSSSFISNNNENCEQQFLSSTSKSICSRNKKYQANSNVPHGRARRRFQTFPLG